METHKIEVIGSGCRKCKALYELTKEIATELNIFGEVEYNTDVTKIIQMGVMSSPVLVIDGNPILAGSLPDKDKLREIITVSIGADQNKVEPEQKEKGCCSCGGSC